MSSLSPTALEHSTPESSAASPASTHLKTGAPSQPETRPQESKPTARPDWHIELLPVERIEPNPYQPRLSFDSLEMADLVASVHTACNSASSSESAKPI